MLDGFYHLTDGVPVFHAVPPPTTEQLQTLLTRIIKRVMKVLTRKGALIEEAAGIPYLADADRDPALAPLHAAACTYHIALGPRAYLEKWSRGPVENDQEVRDWGRVVGSG